MVFKTSLDCRLLLDLLWLREIINFIQSVSDALLVHASLEMESLMHWWNGPSFIGNISCDPSYLTISVIVHNIFTTSYSFQWCLL